MAEDHASSYNRSSAKLSSSL